MPKVPEEHSRGTLVVREDGTVEITGGSILNIPDLADLETRSMALRKQMEAAVFG